MINYTLSKSINYSFFAKKLCICLQNKNKKKFLQMTVLRQIYRYLLLHANIIMTDKRV